MFEKLGKTKKGIIVETPGAHDPLQIIEDEEEDSDAEKDTLFHQQMARIDPTYDFDTFRAYIGKLNRLIRANMPFITMTFRITKIKISIILANSFLPKCIKEAVFDSTLSKTAVVVQYTIVQPQTTKNMEKDCLLKKEVSEDQLDKEFVRLKKFKNAK